MKPVSQKMVRVWDPLVRLFHWTTVLCFFGAYIFVDPRSLHEAFGYTVLAALGTRLVWGVIGTRHARFCDFVTGPRRLIDYFRDMLRGRETRYLGHNPAGSAMVVALMLALAAIGTTGWMMGLDAFWGEDWVEQAHEFAVNGTLILVGLHIAGVAWESWHQRENLVKSMITGRKRE